MNDHNLDDLIIDTIEPKNTKTKSLLTIVALSIVVLIVAIILTKTLLKSPDNAELTFEENVSELVAPELKLQEPEKEIAVAKPEIEESALSTIIEEKITASNDNQKTIVEKEVKTPEITQKKVVTIPTEKTVHTKVSSVPDINKPIIKKPVKPKPVKPKTEIKKQIVKPSPKPVKKSPVTHKVPKAVQKGTYYVQVGSFKEQPSSRFLSVIKSSGFKYHVTKPDRTGYKKLLIGPYKTRAEVDKARDVIRDRIHKSAFVVQK